MGAIRMADGRDVACNVSTLTPADIESTIIRDGRDMVRQAHHKVFRPTIEFTGILILLEYFHFFLCKNILYSTSYAQPFTGLPNADTRQQ
jgi:hypothetical protein